MRPLPFAALYLVCLAVLLGLRFAVGSASPTADATVARPAEAVMQVPPKPEGLGRTDGVGEGEGSSALTQARCDAMPRDVRDVCLQSLARQLAVGDPDGAVAVCGTIGDTELALECRADVAEALAPSDRAAAEAICTAIDRVKWRGQCFFGTGLATAELDADYALGRCEHAEIFRDFCRHDVVGEVALVNLDAAVAFCSREEGDTLTRKTCWHGIGKYLARRSLDEAVAACTRATPEWRSNCIHGAGWGAAERDPDTTLAACARLAEHPDSCRQGVAHQLKRFDPERAVTLCSSIVTESIRTRCLDFVRR